MQRLLLAVVAAFLLPSSALSFADQFEDLAVSVDILGLGEIKEPAELLVEGDKNGISSFTIYTGKLRGNTVYIYSSGTVTDYLESDLNDIRRILSAFRTKFRAISDDFEVGIEHDDIAWPPLYTRKDGLFGWDNISAALLYGKHAAMIQNYLRRTAKRSSEEGGERR